MHEGFYRFSMDTPRVYRCKRNDGCVGGPGAGDAMCADHHRGPLCQLCDKGYYMEPILRRCQRCDRRPSTFLMVAFCVIVIVFFVLVVVIAWSMWRSLWDTQFAKRLKEQCVGMICPLAADEGDSGGYVGELNKGWAGCKGRLKNGWVGVKKNSKAFAGWLRVQLGVDFLTSSCQQAIWHSWMVLVRFSSVEDVTYPGPMKWLLRAAGLVTIDLAAWLPTPCVEWSYYHTLLFATIFPVVYVAVAVLYKNFAQIRDYAAEFHCANYISERFRSLTDRLKVVPEPAPAPAPAPAPGTSVPEAPAPERNKALTEALIRDVQSFFEWCFRRKNVVRALIMVHAPICSVLFEFFHFDGTEYNGFSTRGHKRELYLARDYTIKESSAKYQGYRRYAIFCCTVYVVLVPLAFFSALFIKKLRDGHFAGERKQLMSILSNEAAQAIFPKRQPKLNASFCRLALAKMGSWVRLMTFLLIYGPLTPVIWLDKKNQGARDLVDALWDELMEPYKATGWYWLMEPVSMIVRASLSGFLLTDICLPGAPRM